MFIIDLNYKVPLEEIDAHMKMHVAFLKKYYASGNFLVSGRKVPRNGGVILAVAKNKQEIEMIIKEDPFHKNGIAEFKITEFNASQKSSDINELISQAGE